MAIELRIEVSGSGLGLGLGLGLGWESGPLEPHHLQEGDEKHFDEDLSLLVRTTDLIGRSTGLGWERI